MSSTPRFFVALSATPGDIIALPPDAAHHARNVLRMRPGESLTLHDGANRAYDAVLTEVGRDAVLVSIQALRTLDAEPVIRVTVGQALPRTLEKAELVLQHGTEVGAAGFVLFQAERSVARMEGKDKIEKRIARWRAIIQGAAEQSGRGVLPAIAWLSGAKDLIRTFADYDAVLILHESAIISLRAALEGAPAAMRPLILVGPEGGFTENEIRLLAAAGAVPITLGPRILRTETAALVALSQILFQRA